VDSGYRTGVADYARPRDRRDNISCPTDHSVIAEDRDEPLDAVNAVLKRNHTGVGAHERARLLTRRLGIPQLYGEQHHVDWSDLLRVIGDVNVLQMKVGKGALFDALLRSTRIWPLTATLMDQIRKLVCRKKCAALRRSMLRSLALAHTAWPR
jgi:hypothetical protein